MSLTLDADIYEPSTDDDGNYIDYLPPSNKFTNGIRCLCGSRKNHIFYTKSAFNEHRKTNAHQKWLIDLNTNKNNHFIESQKLKELVSTQKILLAERDREIINLKKELQTKSHTIDILSQQIYVKNQQLNIDLLNFD